MLANLEKIWEFYSFVHTSAPLTHWAVWVRRVSGLQLINFPQTWGEQRTLVHGKDSRRIQLSLCSWKKPTNFGSQRTVCELFGDDAAQVRSPIHTYTHLVRERFANHSARSCIQGLRNFNKILIQINKKILTNYSNILREVSKKYY